MNNQLIEQILEEILKNKKPSPSQASEKNPAEESLPVSRDGLYRPDYQRKKGQERIRLLTKEVDISRQDKTENRMTPDMENILRKLLK